MYGFFCHNRSKQGKGAQKHFYINLAIFGLGVRVCFENGWGLEASRGPQGEGGPSRSGCLCTDSGDRWQTHGRVWRMALRGADRKLLPSTSSSFYPAGDRLVPHLELKRERCGRREQNSVRLANSLLDSPLCLWHGIPCWYFRRSKAAGIPWLFWVPHSAVAKVINAPMTVPTRGHLCPKNTFRITVVT